MTFEIREWVNEKKQCKFLQNLELEQAFDKWKELKKKEPKKIYSIYRERKYQDDNG